MRFGDIGGSKHDSEYSLCGSNSVQERFIPVAHGIIEAEAEAHLLLGHLERAVQKEGR